MANLKQKFGAKLKALRLERSITQERLAEYVDVTTHSISNIERGINGVTFDRLEKIAEFLDIEVHILFIFFDT